MTIKKELDKDKALKMIEALLESKKSKLPDTKSLKDFGGGHVECIKTKANIVLYFGFDGSKNRVSIKCQINREDVLLWMEALSERVWNVETAEEAINIDSLLATAEPSDKKLDVDSESLFPPNTEPISERIAEGSKSTESIFNTIPKQ